MSIAFLDERQIVRPHGTTVRAQRHLYPLPSAGAGARARAGAGTRRSDIQRSRPDVGRPGEVGDVVERAFARQPESRRVPAAETGRPALRLTHRGQLVLGALLVLVALVVFSLGRFSAGADAAGPATRVTVAAGDTLWSIAAHAAPAGDPRTEIDRIVSANHLASGSALTPGTVLLVPQG